MLPRKNQSQLKKKSSQNCLNCDVLKEKLSLNIIIVTIFLSGGKIRGKKNWETIYNIVKLWGKKKQFSLIISIKLYFSLKLFLLLFNFDLIYVM